MDKDYPLKANAKVYVITHTINDILMPPLISTSLTKCLNALMDVVIDAGVSEDAEGIWAMSDKIRRNIAHSLNGDDDGKTRPFTMVHYGTDDNKKHVFRVDREYVNIGVHLQ